MTEIQSSQTLPSQSNQKDFYSKKSNGRIVFRIFKILVLVLFVCMLVQVFFFLTSYFSRYPDNKMCWSDPMCKNYCLYDWKPTCRANESPVITDRMQQFKYVITGKKNILETYNPSQKYCACTDMSATEKTREELYDFYQKNR
jgi:hypothetical protein